MSDMLKNVLLFSVCLICLLSLVIFGETIFVKEAKAQPPNSGISGMGSGIVTRNDGSIIIDAWKSFVTETSKDGKPEPRLKEYPPSITMGKSLSGLTNICYENTDGSTTCTLLSRIRK